MIETNSPDIHDGAEHTPSFPPLLSMNISAERLHALDNRRGLLVLPSPNDK
jgi:hypothetical protein